MVRYLFMMVFTAFSVSIFSVKGQSVSNDSSLPVEIAGITVVPHYVSGEIPSYKHEKGYLSKYRPGALIRIFIRNTDTKSSINPEVLFNGKTGQELISQNVISYCDVPDTRRISSNISTEIPPKAMDCYLLNVVDSNFYSNGITLKFTDKIRGQTAERQLPIKTPDLYVSRIVFTSSDGSCTPDGFYIYINNDSDQDVKVARVKIWKAGHTYSQHWWSDSFTPDSIICFGNKGKIESKGINGALVKTGSLPFGETILELDIYRESCCEKMFYAVKPMIINFDISMGWGANYLAGSEAFCKTIKFMHFNTVNGDANGFFENKEWSGKYEMKKFSRLLEESSKTEEGNLKTIHGSEFFGEPQFSKVPAQDIFNFYTAYRNSGFPTTLTLSHEPGFFLYAGVVDFAHFDAYRVVAPHADKWGDYQKYGNKNVRWGSPLETIGYYMRTLNRINFPNRVAAWTQAMADDWKSRYRFNAGNPNNLEMRIQAYEAIANGATSLYWFNMGGKTLINNRNSLAEIQRINREIKVVDSLLVNTVPYWWQNRLMDLDLNVLAGPDFATLSAIDLRYKVSESNQFVSDGKREETMIFKIPPYLNSCNAVVKVSYEGVSDISVKLNNGYAIITDTLETTGLYILFKREDKDLRDILTKKYLTVKAIEASLKFDPINNNSDFMILTEEVNKIK